MITIEEHWSTPELAAAVKAGRGDDSLALNERGDTLSRLEDIGDARLAVMDAQGVDVQVLSLAPPGTGPAELERTAGLGFVGAMVYGRTGEIPLDDPRYDDLFATAAALGVPVSIHPQIPSDATRAALYGGFDGMTELALATFGWGWHMEAAVAALRLIVRGTFDRHPDLQIILGHWGELLPFWSDRTNGIARVAGLDRTVSEYLRANVYLSSSGMFSPALLRHALEVTTMDRLLFSTDYPFHQPARAEIDEFLREFASEDDREKFTAGNARKLKLWP